jgi:hypothetical protein
MPRQNAQSQFAPLALWAFVGWLGMYVHNVVDLPGLTLASPENSLPALVSVALVSGWRLLPWKRAIAALLLGWALLHAVGGGVLSVVPLPIWPFTPAQTPTHYAMHVVYGLAQLPLIWLLGRWLRPQPTRQPLS